MNSWWLGEGGLVFEASEPARFGRLVWWGERVDDLEVDREVRVAVADGDRISTRTVPAVNLPVADVLAALAGARHSTMALSPSAAYWSAATTVALNLIARGRILPGLTDGDYAAWRIGPLDAGDLDTIRRLAAAMPVACRAVPLDGVEPLTLPDAETLLRAFLDAIADTFPRTGGKDHGVLAPFAAVSPHRVPGLRAWSNQVAAELDCGLRISLRLQPAGDDDADLESAPLRAVVQVHSVADPARVVDAAALWSDNDTGFGGRARIDVSLALGRAARAWPPLGRILDRAVPDELELGDDELIDLLSGAAGRLGESGVDVHWPRGLVRSLTARATLGASDLAPSDLPKFFSGGQHLSLNWQLTLDGSTLTAAELEQLAEASRPIVRLRDQWLLVDPKLAAKAAGKPLRPLSPMDAVGAALSRTVTVDGAQVEVAPTAWLDQLRERIAAAGDEPIAPPAALHATLRGYQLRGLGWLVRLTELGLGGCLADDMGLGKTVTLIALHLHRQADPGTAGPTLVVCPASLLGNWQREIERFAPGTVVHRFHGGQRSLDEATGGFVLTTYGTMRRDAERLAAHGWGLLVADEAQHIKNPLSGTAKALRKLGNAIGPGGARIALTGTPIENNLSELWSILDWTTPGLLGSLGRFRTRFAKPIEADRDTETARRLARIVRPFLLRRRKSDPGIAPELPGKTETDQPVSLTAEQAALYEATVRELMTQIRDGDGMARRGRVVKLLTALKQICNHPAQYLKEDRPRLAGRSGKLELLDELVDTIGAEDGAVLVFTQYVAMGRLLEQHLNHRGIGNRLLHGGTPVAQREQMVRDFQGGEVPVFLLSLKAAGTGLNLTRADHVVHYDRWWNPAVEDQATDRAYRIGQIRPVQVHRLIAEGTLEDRIAQMLATKRDLAQAVLTSGAAAMTELTDDELAELVELRGA